MARGPRALFLEVQEFFLDRKPEMFILNRGPGVLAGGKTPWPEMKNRIDANLEFERVKIQRTKAVF